MAADSQYASPATVSERQEYSIAAGEELVLGSVEDEIDIDAFEANLLDALPPGAQHTKHRMQLAYLRCGDMVSKRLGGKDETVAQKLMGSPTMDVEQMTHVEHFFYAQLARDARLGYFDAERVLFIKKAKPTHLVRNMAILPLIFPLMYLLVHHVYSEHPVASCALALALSLWVILANFYHASNSFYVFSTDRLVFIAPTWTATLFQGGYGAMRVTATLSHSQVRYTHILMRREGHAACVAFTMRTGSNVCAPQMFLVSGGLDLVKVMPGLPVVAI